MRFFILQYNDVDCISLTMQYTFDERLFSKPTLNRDYSPSPAAGSSSRGRGSQGNLAFGSGQTTDTELF